MFNRLLTVVFLSAFSISEICAQETTSPISLEQCIEIALAHNLNLKSAGLTTETEEIQFKRSQNALLPNVNANYNLGLSNGRSIDPFTNGYVNEQLTFSNAGLTLEATVFKGFKLLNTIKQNSLNKKASEMEFLEARQNLVLEVTLSFLQVLNTRELLKLAKSRVVTSAEQLERLTKLNEEETGDPAASRDFEGQVALDKSAVTDAQNSLSNAVIDLEVLLNNQLTIHPDNLVLLLEFEKQEITAQKIYKEALANLATVKAKELRLEAATKGVAVAKSAYSPQISLFANLGTNYSSAARVFDDAGSQVTETGDFVTVSGTDYAVFTEQTIFNANPIQYGNQLENNLNSTAGVSVNVPLFNGFAAKNAVQLEKINKEQAEVDLEQTKLELSRTIQKAYNDREAAFLRYKLVEDQEEAFEASFHINETRFNLGVSTSVDYIISKNKLDNVRINLANLKYEYVLRTQVLEYYRGNLN